MIFEERASHVCFEPTHGSTNLILYPLTVEIREKCGILYLVCKKKDFTNILDVSWCPEIPKRHDSYYFPISLSEN